MECPRVVGARANFIKERGRTGSWRRIKEERHGEEQEESRKGGGRKKRERDERSSLLKPPLRKSGLAGLRAVSPLGRISKSNVIIKLSPCGPCEAVKGVHSRTDRANEASRIYGDRNKFEFPLRCAQRRDVRIHICEDEGVGGGRWGG